MISSIISILSAVVLVLLFIGAIVGVFRGWIKSTIRFGLILISLILSIVIVPIISQSVVNNCINGTTLTMFGMSIDLKEFAETYLSNSEFFSDLFSMELTTDAIVSILHIVVNIVLYFSAFFAIWFFSLIVYGIVSLCISAYLRNKSKNESKKESQKDEKDSTSVQVTYEKSNNGKKKKSVTSRVIGGVVGFLSMVLISFALFVPVFGVMNVCDQFLQESETSSNEANASASSLENLVCGTLYYTDDENIGVVESYIEMYAGIKESYNSTLIGKFFNTFGLYKLGTKSFDYLSTVKTNDLEIRLTDELTTVIKTYNIYKENFVAKEFDITDNNSIEAIAQIYDSASSSNLVENLILEVMGKFYTAWSNDTSYLGISCPVSGSLKPIFLEIYKTILSDDISVISSNFETILDIVKIANDHELISAVKDGENVLEVVANDETLVYDVVCKLVESNEIKSNISNILTELISWANTEIIGSDEEIEATTLSAEEIDAIVWKGENGEATYLQGMVTKILTVYVNLDAGGDIMDELGNLGAGIDYARKSQIISSPTQTFISAYINSDSLNLDDDVKAKINKYIVGYTDDDENYVDYWNDESYSFESLFSVVSQTVSIASSLTNSEETISIESLSEVLTTIIESESLKETVTELITSEEITLLIPDEYADTVEVLTDIVTEFISTSTTNTLENDLAAAQEIVNLVTASTNSTSLDLDSDSATEIVEKIASSDAVMNVINTATRDENTSSTLQTYVNSIKEEDRTALTDAILSEETQITSDQQELLLKLFGLTNTEE